MAASRPSGGQYALSIRYGDKSKPFYFNGEELVNFVVKKAASDLRIAFEERSHLILVHMGAALPKDATLKESLKNDMVTCCFLQMSCRGIRSSIADVNNRKDVGKCLGFCVECGMVVQTRPIFECGSCRMKNFQLDNFVNLFDDDHSTITGVCNDCGHKGKPSITHECAARINPDGRTHSAVFLHHLRQNVLELPCMKCEHKEKEIIKFHCNHTMCRFCFGNMCRMQFDVVGGFTHHHTVGYSIGCPAEGKNCSTALITDPHHFYLIDGKKGFYTKYQEKAFDAFQRKEARPICQKCHTQLDMSQRQEAEVLTPASLRVDDSIPVEAGGAWISLIKLFRKTPSQAPEPEQKKTRRQLTCTGCQSLYCGECIQIWHEGNCIRLSEDQIADANKFKVEFKKAAASEWK